MNNYLIFFIATAICLHLMEYYIKKFKKLFSVTNIIVHSTSFLAFALLKLELVDLFVFFLISSIVSLALMLKEVKNGI